MGNGYTIYHNPRCSKSRAVLARLRDAGHVPDVIEYMKTPPSEEVLKTLLGAMGLTARELLRTKETAYAELRLADAEVGEVDLVSHMAANPILIERPIVVRGDVMQGGAVRLCRPPEIVDELLEMS